MWCGSSRRRSRARTTSRTSTSRPTASGRAGRPGSTTRGACSSARRGTIRSIPWKASWCTSFPGAPARRWRRPPENSGSEPDLVFTYVKTRSGFDPELLFAEPVLLEADAQRHARAVEQDPAVVGGDRELLADLVGLEARVLAQHEDLRGARREPGEAGFEHLQELLLLQRPVGILPGLRMLAPVLALVEERVEVGGGRLGIFAGQRAFAARAAHRVDALVLQDAGEPGAQVRAALEARLGFERREQRLLHRVLGRFAVAELQRGVTQEIGSKGLDLGTEIASHPQYFLIQSLTISWARSVCGPGSATHMWSQFSKISSLHSPPAAR